MAEAAVAATTVVPIVKRAPQLRPASFKRAHDARTAWVAEIPHGVPFEALLEPGYWAHIAHMLTNPATNKRGWGDLIEVYPEDMSYFAMLFVRDCGAAWAKVVVVYKVDFDDAVATVPVDCGMTVEFKGRIQRYTVVRTRDNAVMASGFNTEAEAKIALIKLIEQQNT